MPRELTIISRRAPAVADLRAAAAAAGIAAATVVRARDGAMEIIRDAEGRPVLTLGYTRLIAVAAEVRRLSSSAAEALPGPVYWTEAWARLDRDGATAGAVALAIAERCDGVCVRADGTLA